MAEWADLGDLHDDETPAGASKRVNCFQCVWFRTTWDPLRPRGCDYFEFKGTEMPSAEVRRTTGKDCIMFRKKTTNGSNNA